MLHAHNCPHILSIEDLYLTKNYEQELFPQLIYSIILIKFTFILRFLLPHEVLSPLYSKNGLRTSFVQSCSEKS